MYVDHHTRARSAGAAHEEIACELIERLSVAYMRQYDIMFIRAPVIWDGRAGDIDMGTGVLKIQSRGQVDIDRTRLRR